MAYGYVIANVDVTDPARYADYRILSTEAITAHGGEVLVRGGKSELLEGQLHPRVVVIRFPDFAAARRFYDSAEYQAARAARAAYEHDSGRRRLKPPRGEAHRGAPVARRHAKVSARCALAWNYPYPLRKL